MPKQANGGDVLAAKSASTWAAGGIKDGNENQYNLNEQITAINKCDQAASDF